MKAVTLLSGGLDSVTLAYTLRTAGELSFSDPNIELIALSFDYGQRHKKRELNAAHAIALELGIEHHEVHIGVLDVDHPIAAAPLASILGDSVLVNHGKTVPDGHYAEENMKATVVPNRNAIMLSIAYGVAVARQADYVFFAAHSGDHAIYPDCRPEFVDMLAAALQVGNRWSTKEKVPLLKGPFLFVDKTEIARIAARVGVPIDKTWSCYKGGQIHCGTCGTCYERREAFKLAGVEDPTTYLDSTTEFAAPAP